MYVNTLRTFMFYLNTKLNTPYNKNCKVYSAFCEWVSSKCANNRHSSRYATDIFSVDTLIKTF